MPPEERLPPWPLWLVPIAVLGAVVLAVFGFALVRGGLLIAGVDVDSGDAALTIPSLVAQDLALVGAALFAAGLVRRPRPADFGLVLTRPGRTVGAVLVAMAVFYGISLLLSQVIELEQQNDLSEQVGADESTLALAGFAIVVVVVAPVVEEFFFRGFLYTTLRRAGGTLLATALVGVLFGLVHAATQTWEAVVVLSILGAVFCELYRRTGSIVPCIVFHSVNNALALAASQNWTAGEGLAVLVAGLAGIAAVVGPVAYRGSRASATSPASSAPMPPVP